MDETTTPAPAASPRQLSERQARQRDAVLAVIGGPAAEEPAERPAPSPTSPSTPAAVPPPPAEPARPPRPARARRHLLSEFVHRHAAAPRRAAPALAATHPVAAHRRHYLRWVWAALAVAVATPVAAWLAIYRFGADGPATKLVASLLPLEAGRVGAATLTVDQLYRRVAWHPRLNASPLGAAAPVAEGDKAAAFRAWVDEQLVRSQLVARGQAVTAEQLTRELARVQRGIGEGGDLARWTRATYGLDAADFREYILRPAAERARLATILSADRQRYGQAWEQAEAASRVRGLVGMSDQGWLDSLDVGPAVADALAATSRDTRTSPVPTPLGLAVYRYSESATDERGATYWHLWQLLFPLDPVADFLAQARAAADVSYYLPR